MLVDRIGTQPLLPQHIPVIALNMAGLQILKRKPAQSGNDVVPGNISVTVIGGSLPVGTNHFLQPIVQPFPHRHPGGRPQSVLKPL